MDPNTTLKWITRRPDESFREQNKETRIYGAMNGALAPAAIEAMEQWTWPNVESVTHENRETDEAKRTALYQKANREIMKFLPGVPYVNTEPALAFNSNVKGYVPSPVSLEQFSKVEVE